MTSLLALKLEEAGYVEKDKEYPDKVIVAESCEVCGETFELGDGVSVRSKTNPNLCQVCNYGIMKGLTRA